MVTGGFMGITAPDWIATNIDRQWAKQDADWTQQQSAIAAAKQMDFQERMSNTAWQRGTKDMIAAGINPMLATHTGGASSPQGAGFPGQMPRPPAWPKISAQLQTAAQTRLLEAAAEKTDAEKNEVIARTPTHAVTMDKMRQEIGESAMRIERIIAETDREIASAANIRQQTENLRASVPQIQAQIQQIRAATKLTGKETEDVEQRVKANLPEVERALKRLEEQSRLLNQPRAEMDRSVNEGFIGAMGAVIRALSPLHSITNIGR